MNGESTKARTMNWMQGSLMIAVSVLVGVAIGYAVWHGKHSFVGGQDTTHHVHFVVLKGGAVFYAPQPGDELTWYKEGDAQTEWNQIAVTFPDPPCTNSPVAAYFTTQACDFDKDPAKIRPGFYAYYCPNKECQDPGVAPGSKGGNGTNIKPDPQGHPAAVSIVCKSNVTTLEPSTRRARVGDTITWLSSLPWSITLQDKNLCYEGYNLNNQNNLCTIKNVPSVATYQVNVTTGCSDGPNGPPQGSLDITK